MGFMKHIRSLSHLANRDRARDAPHDADWPPDSLRSPGKPPWLRHSKKASSAASPAPVYTYAGPDCTAALPDAVLRRIFLAVCPHAADESLDASEHATALGDGCMLCDVRDLSNCSKACRKWYPVASGVLCVRRPLPPSTAADPPASYHSIRIDPVHYCELEEVYIERRRRKSRGHDDADPPAQRLQQLCRTVRANQYCAAAVCYLKLPYMTREACKTNLARTVSVLPNLVYVDLPDGFFAAEPTCHALRIELQARCPRLQKMKFAPGSEAALELLLQGVWRELRVVDVAGLRFELAMLRRVLGALVCLEQLSLSDLPWLGDNVFQSAPAVPQFPPLARLALADVPAVTHDGLLAYLAAPPSRHALRTLELPRLRRRARGGPARRARRRAQPGRAALRRHRVERAAAGPAAAAGVGHAAHAAL